MLLVSDMDAIALLKSQHRLVEELFSRFEKADDEAQKHALFDEIADNLAVHCAIEEQFFYPAVRARQTEEELEEAYDEHLDAKKIILDAMGHPDAPGFDGKVAALQGAIEHHVEEEEGELFPAVEKLLLPEALEALGQIMEREALRLMEQGAPRRHIAPKPEEPRIQP
jgi:hemerythrin superfamily protein